MNRQTYLQSNIIKYCRQIFVVCVLGCSALDVCFAQTVDNTNQNLAVALERALSTTATSSGTPSLSASQTTSTTTSTQKPQPSVALAGNDWYGYMDLVNGHSERVRATVVQNNTDITITTSSSQSYGKVLKGKLSSDRDLLVYDQTTGEDWSTHYNPATGNRIDLYDYVNIDTNGYHDLDRILLVRASK